jgi:hypothetical protein
MDFGRFCPARSSQKMKGRLCRLEALLREANMQSKTTGSNPTHEQAQLQLQLYEERRETRLREARDC